MAKLPKQVNQFSKQYPKIWHAFNELGERCHEAGPLDEDEEMLRASTRKLLDLVQREQVPLIIFGHDGEQWQTLKKAPDFYG